MPFVVKKVLPMVFMSGKLNGKINPSKKKPEYSFIDLGIQDNVVHMLLSALVQSKLHFIVQAIKP